MAVNTYETLIILDSNAYSRDPGGLAKQIEDLVTQSGGNVLVNRMWMEQKLAYPIGGHQKGTYWLTYFESEGDTLAKLKRAFQLCEPVVREMTVKLEPRLVEPILANARGETITHTATDASTAEGSGDSAAAPEAEKVGSV